MAAKFKACSIDGCNGNAHRRAHGYRGWCSKHYDRWRHHGDPLGGGAARAPKGEPLAWVEEVALKHEDRDTCLTWPYSTDGNGYGEVRLEGRLRLVSRLVCEAVNGPPPTPEHQAAHNCGKGHEACVNPWHLRWATRVENKADQIEHGTHIRGERCGAAKLTEPEVIEIRCLLTSCMLQREIAARFGVARETVTHIANRKTWAWLEDGSEVKNEDAA